MIFPDCITGKIVEFSGDRVVLWVLKEYINPTLYKNILLQKRRFLIYGEVQSGKTAAIIETIKNPFYSEISKIVIIQNSILVLNQYIERFTMANIDFQVIDHRSKIVEKEVIIIINNISRYERFLNIQRNTENNTHKKYILLMDESDSYYGGKHPLTDRAVHEFYITATPNHKLYRTPGFFHRIKRIDSSPQYKGLKNIKIEYNNSPISGIIQKFYEEVNTQNQRYGMLLINSYKRIKEMLFMGTMFSREFQNIIFITLNSERKILFRGEEHKMKTESISKIIDYFEKYNAKYVVFIANRMSLRGLSYCSSDFKRHLTHQYSDLVSGTVTNSLQRMRIFGKYIDDIPIKLFLPSSNKKIIDSMLRVLDIDFEISRDL